jgi:TetR/AcrR family transcriptional regulator, cholesterol catabolism regulator
LVCLISVEQQREVEAHVPGSKYKAQRTKFQRPKTKNQFFVMPDFTKHDQKLEFILRNAARIFAEKNYHSTTMRDISRATSVSLAGLYHYCKSKEELLFLIQDNCFGRVLERLEERLAEVNDPVSKLRVFIENHLSFFAANMAEMKVLSHEAESLAGDLHTHVSTKKEKYTRLAREILKDIQEQQEGRPQIDLTVATYALFGMMNWIYNWYDPQGKLKVAELVDNVMHLFLRGFVAGLPTEQLDFAPEARVEPLSVWRGTL